MVPPHEIARLDHEELLREEFNRWARDDRVRDMERWHRPVTEKVVERMQLSPDERILDVGCGDGWTCRLLSPLAPEGAVVGIDVADEMIALARGRSIELDNILFAPGSVEEIPWAEDYFSRVLSVESAYYWHSPEKAAREIFRVTAWGGQVFILLFYYRENAHALHWQEHAPARFQLKSAGEWQEVFELLGFQDVRTEQVPDTTPVAPDFEPDVHWRSREEREAFQQAGGLLLTATKPPLPEPGPLASEPNPLRILP